MIQPSHLIVNLPNCVIIIVTESGIVASKEVLPKRRAIRHEAAYENTLKQCGGNIFWQRRRREVRFWMNSSRLLDAIERQPSGCSVAGTSPGRTESVDGLGGMVLMWPKH